METSNRLYQHLLINEKKNLDVKVYGGAASMDLSKAFNTFNYDLLLAILSVYYFKHDALKLTYSYLSNRPHRTNGTLTQHLVHWKN